MKIQSTTEHAAIDPELLLNAYRSGIFPMAESREGEIRWYEPKRRAIFPLDGLIVSRSLGQTLHKNVYEVRFNSEFESVMRCCAGREETWISEAIVKSYCELHRLGRAFSVESWHEAKLVGGLYGVALGGAFFGESMYSTLKDSSKVALVALVRRLREKHFVLLDAQFMTPHLRSLGAVEISQREYLQRLSTALQLQRSFLL